MPQVTVVVPFWLQHSVYYGVGQFNVSGGMVNNAWVREHLKDGQPDPEGTPLTDPGVATICTRPPDADGHWPS
jgi:hypothetical protein